MFEKTKSFCDTFLDMGVPGFDLILFHKGECILRHKGGYSDLEKKEKINGKERYNLYSCSKVITCAAALMLWEKGAFSLEDRLSDYMSEFGDMTVRCGDGIRKAEKPILIKHLFEMTAGFTYDVNSENLKKCVKETGGECPTREAMKYLACDPLLFEPGDRWHYSLCHDVLGALVEVIAGERFEEFVKKNIFEPLSMKDSTFLLDDNDLDTLSPQYIMTEDGAVNIGKRIVEYKLGHRFVSGGAGCISTADDYMKFLEGLRRGLILKPETVRLMRTSRLTEEQRRTFTVNDMYDYGLGVRCPKENSHRQDFGWGGAAGAFALIDEGHEVSMYLACHTLRSPASPLRYMIYEFIKAELFGERSFSELDAELSENYKYNFTY